MSGRDHGSLNLYQWLDQIRSGDAAGYRTVLIHLMSEDHAATVLTWSESLTLVSRG